jgi:transposase InsO family protein
MAASGFGGNQRIAQTLARAGWKLSRETVRRIRNDKPVAEPTSTTPSSSSRSVTARRPNHVWMIDVTEIPSWFGLFTFKLVVVLDVFSRYPLVWKTFWLEPSSRDIRLLLRRAIRRVGAPRYLRTDHGAQFTARSLRRWLRHRNIHHRFGAIGKTGSIAIIERFWKTAKELLGFPFLRPLLKPDLDRRIHTVLAYYSALKHHHTLHGDTPAECFLQRPAIPLVDRPPPRARLGERTEPAQFRIKRFRGEPRLPYLASVAA